MCGRKQDDDLSYICEITLPMRIKLKFYHYFLDGIPQYLARHYWWAYLWRPAVWFFDHQFIINGILFFQYKKLMTTTMKRIEVIKSERILQLSCVYGSLTPNILKSISPEILHITDVAKVQLDNIRRKLSGNKKLLASRMNAEQLAYKEDTFSTVVLFFLLHEMPAKARRNTLSECLRVISPGGRLLCTEYGALPVEHFLYRCFVCRWVLIRLEPFLAGYWQEDITVLLKDLARPYGKDIEVIYHTNIFSGFYRVTEFRIIDV
ncbi:MAG: rhodoquinone biosynthesis methyltransferase RquA [Gammaproteobacteria bacterium]|nr:rhodoquinone biosynthesis methyltransferase RquA [Gammaproteobacteria bacterium]